MKLADKTIQLCEANGRLLICDDEPEIVEILVDMLTDEGFKNIDTALTGKDALKLIKKNKYKWLLVDRLVKSKNPEFEWEGEEVAGAFKEKDPKSRVVAFTGDNDYKAKGNVDKVVHKPADVSVIAKALLR